MVGSARIQPDVVEDLLAVYGHDDPEELVKLKLWARVARDKGYWQKGRRGLPDNMADFGEYEERAAVQRVWEPLLVPGLCQTERYARAVITGIEPSIEHDELERRVAARMARQAVLTREDPQELWVLLDERVLRARIGSIPVRVEQLRRLVELASWSNVTLRVVGAAAGAHPGLSGWFTIFGFHEDTPDIGYTDGPGGSLYLADSEDVRRRTLTFGHLLGIALTPADSIALISEVIDELEREPQ
ncbi:MAG: XRE family transcriptional regulator [Saccharothrix sp.]|nr:XRE family transcriptional regulator [Saccharothrix sp.]